MVPGVLLHFGSTVHHLRCVCAVCTTLTLRWFQHTLIIVEEPPMCCVAGVGTKAMVHGDLSDRFQTATRGDRPATFDLHVCP